MPRGDTDIPHVAFSHHRIGIHRAKSTLEPNVFPELVPLDDESRLSAFDRQRNLGLAYFEVCRLSTSEKERAFYHERAWNILESLPTRGRVDGETAAVLASMYWKKDRELCNKFAQQALEDKNTPSASRSIVLFLIANSLREENDPQSAILRLQELSQLERNSEVWRVLGQCYLDSNRPREALEAFNKALTIRPFRQTIHLGLADAYSRLGNKQLADEHRETARWLALNRRD
jgi:tetratricopeptide (TPR) repeat protein